jgi:negative regulator of flagellin synthesis FlgM
MKISQKGPADTDLSQAVQNDKPVQASQRDGEKKVQHRTESAKVSISAEARELQRIAELAEAGNKARAEKVQRIKEEVEAGTYQADATDVAKSILRTEVGRLMEKE